MSFSKSTLPQKKDPGLDYLFSDIQFLKGVGPKKGEAFKQCGIGTVYDLFYYVPRKYLDRSQIFPIADLAAGMSVTIVGKVGARGIMRGRNLRFEVILEDNTGSIELVWFKGYKYLEDAFAIGDLLYVSGKVSEYGRLYLAHPEFEIIGSVEDDTIHTARIIPIYPQNATLKNMGLHSRGLRRIIKPALERLSEIGCETIPERWRKEYGLTSLSESIYQVHFPETIQMADSGRQRLAFEELFYLELIMAGRHKKRRAKTDGIIIHPPTKNGRKLLNNLGFKLTKSQIKVLNEIYADMGASYRMNRLIQGDVGSGKTIVAVLAMLGAVESGYQAAIMAPTEILAEQHFHSLTQLLKPLGIEIRLLTSSIKNSAREKNLKDISSGKAQVIVGTHALIQKGVSFNKLGFAVIDEQHRFGVVQRADLQAKGFNPDVLVMTATPIPRSLAMTIYGDLDVSVIDEMPPGRLPIATRFVPEEKRDEMDAFIKRNVKSGQAAFVVLPLVEESEKSDLKAALQWQKKLQAEVFPELKIGLLHGQMKGNTKTSVMTDFKSGKIDILVATTVVEVGLDVPTATMMVIEHADRFGMAQLHQLRGRVGRGAEKSYCFLLAGPELTVEARRRIDVIVSTSDGFKIAEADLDLRGPGEVLGTRQHGMPDLRVARLTDTRLVELARSLAFNLIDDDPELKNEENRQIRTVLKRRLGPKAKFVKIG